MRVELVIERLVLEGVELDAAGRRALVEALAAELGHGLAVAEFSDAGCTLPRLVAPTIVAGVGAATFGHSLAGSMLTALRGGGGRP